MTVVIIATIASFAGFTFGMNVAPKCPPVVVQEGAQITAAPELNGKCLVIQQGALK